MEGKLIFDYLNKYERGCHINFGLQNIPNDEINKVIIVSDYKSFGHFKKSPYSNISAYFVLNYDEVVLISQEINKLRKEIILPRNSFFDYKSINNHSLEGKRKIANEGGFLGMLQKIKGSLMVFFEEEMLLSPGKLKFLADDFEKKELGKWKPHILNQMINTFFHINIIRSKINTINDVVWLSDEDSRLGYNDDQRKNSLEIFKRISQGCHTGGGVNIISQCDNKADKQFNFDRDLKSVPDLACGRMLDCFYYSPHHRDLSRDFFNWFCNGFGDLNRKLICLRTQGDKPTITIR